MYHVVTSFLTCDQELRKTHAAWLERKEEEQIKATRTEERQSGEEEDTVIDGVPAEIETPVAFIHQTLPPVAINTDTPPSILQATEPPTTAHGVDSSSESFVDIPTIAASSPTLSISTISDWTSTELGDGTERNEEQTTTHHDTFYFEDGNTEIACGDTVFRVHSTVVSFSSPKLRDILSPSTLFKAPTPEGCPRIVFTDNPEDFAVLLKMIYTPGYVSLSQMWVP